MNMNEQYKIAIVSASSRKSIAVALSLKTILKSYIIGIFTKKNHPFIYSRMFNKKIILERNTDPRIWILNLLYTCKKEGVGLVFPLDFRDFLIISRYKSLFISNNIKVATPNYEDIIKASNKALLKKEFKDIVYIPNFETVTTLDDLPKIKKVLRLPLVVKGLSDASKPTYHVRYVTAIKEARERIPCLIQEFYPGVGRGYFTISHGGTPLLEFTHQRVIEYEPVGGASLSAKGLIKDPLLYNIGRKIVKKLKWTGPLMIEFRWNPETGEYALIELNPKFWGSIDLPIKLGFHFPAVTALLFLGKEKEAYMLSRKLKIAYNTHTWIIDGLRYLMKDPLTWVKMLGKTLRNPLLTDLTPPDPGRIVMQVYVALRKMPYERRTWLEHLKYSNKSVVHLLQEARENVRRNKLIILDLDGTLVKLKIPWNEVKEHLIVKNYIKPWETISSALIRLWRTDRELFSIVSKEIEEFEKASLKELRKLINLSAIRLLRHAKEAYKIKICIATKQSRNIASQIVKRLGMDDLIDYIVGRDSVKPLKIEMFKTCLKLCSNKNKKGAVVFDDNFTAVIEALRYGLYPIRVHKNSYERFKALRIGIPSFTSVNIALNTLLYRTF